MAEADMLLFTTFRKTSLKVPNFMENKIFNKMYLFFYDCNP